MPSGRTNNFPESGRGLGHVTFTTFGSTVGYPNDSDSLASCLMSALFIRREPTLWIWCYTYTVICGYCTRT